MKKILRKAMNLMGEKTRHKLYRAMVSVPAEYSNPDFRLEIAKTREDLESAYALLHDCYVGIKIIDPQPSGLRCNLFSFLPTTTIIIAKLGNRVVGTVSLIKDSGSGLPSDKEFLKENNSFRQQNKTLIEASALAVAPDFRGNHSVSFLLMKYLYLYSKNCFGGDVLIGAVHPKAEDFYKAIWLFERNGEVVEYNNFKGAAAIHVSLDLTTEHFNKVLAEYQTKDPAKNMGTLISRADDRLLFPRQKTGQSLNPAITPDLLKYFCLEKSDIWIAMSSQDRKELVQVYSTYFGQEMMKDFTENRFPINATQEYRTPIELSSVVKTGDQVNFCNVLDLTSGGCFVNWQTQLPKVGEKLLLSFRLGANSYLVHGEVAWQNENISLRRPRGLGIKFTIKISALNRQLQHWLYETHNSRPVVREMELNKSS